MNSMSTLSLFSLVLGSALLSFVVGYFLARIHYKRKFARDLNKINESQKSRDLLRAVAAVTPDRSHQVVVKESNKKDSASVPNTKETETQPYAAAALRTKRPEQVVAAARTSYLNYTRQKPKLNFEHIGISSIEHKQDLTQIHGIGPYIEERLNEIGIYDFEQISRLSIQDIRVLTDLIDFFPGRIEQDNWMAQAIALK